MPSKRYNTEGIIHKLREADVLRSGPQKLDSSLSEIFT